MCLPLWASPPHSEAVCVAVCLGKAVCCVLLGACFFFSCFFLPFFNQQGNVGSSLCKQTITKSSGTALGLIARTSQHGYVCFRNATDSAERVQGIILKDVGVIHLNPDLNSKQRCFCWLAVELVPWSLSLMAIWAPLCLEKAFIMSWGVLVLVS